MCSPSSVIVSGAVNGANSPRSTDTSTITPGAAWTSSTVEGVNQPAVCVPPREGVTPVPVGAGGGAPTNRNALFVETATFPKASAAWTKYSTRVPPTEAPPPQVAPAPRWRSRNRQVGDVSSRNATSTRTTPAAVSVGRSTASTENETRPDPGSTAASIASRRGARRSVPVERSTERSTRVNSRWVPFPSASTMPSEKNWPCTSTAETRRPVRVRCETSDWIFAGNATSANGNSGSVAELSTIGRANTGLIDGTSLDSRPVIRTPCASSATSNSTFGWSGRRCVTCMPLGPAQRLPKALSVRASVGCER